MRVVPRREVSGMACAPKKSAKSGKSCGTAKAKAKKK
jgi:hypothetical protein